MNRLPSPLNMLFLRHTNRHDTGRADFRHPALRRVPARSARGRGRRAAESGRSPVPLQQGLFGIRGGLEYFVAHRASRVWEGGFL